MSTPRSPNTSRRRARILTTGLLAAALLAPASAPAAQIVAPGPGGSAQFAFVPGSDSGLVHERTLAGSGVLGPAQPVSWSFRYGYSPSIGVDASGAAVIGWSSADGAVGTGYVRRRAPDGSLGVAQRVSPAGIPVVAYRIVVEPDGDAVAVWKRELDSRDVIQLRRRSADGTLGQVRTVSPTTADADEPAFAVAPNGAVTVSWLQTISGEDAVQARTLAPDGTLGTVRRISPEGGNAADQTMAVDGAGRAVFAWTRTLPDGKALESRARSATGTLGAVQIITADQFIGPAAMAVNAAGRVAYAWVRQHNASTWATRGRMRQPGGTLGPEFDIGEASSSRPAVAVDPDGHATFAWRHDTSYDAILTRRRTAAGSMSDTRTMSADATVNAAPQVAVDGGGKATIAWYSTSSNRWNARTVTAGGAVSSIHDLESDGKTP